MNLATFIGSERAKNSPKRIERAHHVCILSTNVRASLGCFQCFSLGETRNIRVNRINNRNLTFSWVISTLAAKNNRFGPERRRKHFSLCHTSHESNLMLKTYVGCLCGDFNCIFTATTAVTQSTCRAINFQNGNLLQLAYSSPKIIPRDVIELAVG